MKRLKQWSKLVLIVAIPLLLHWAPTTLYAQPQNPELLCYGVGDEWLSSNGLETGTLDPNDGSEIDYDYLTFIEKETGRTVPIGKTGTRGIEAIVFGPSRGGSTTNTLYAVAGADNLDNATANTLGTIDLQTGDWTPINAGTRIGSGTGSDGTEFTFTDIDGLAYDVQRNILWATQRNGLPDAPDYLLQIDHTTGLAVEDAFGPGIDWIEIEIATDSSFVTPDGDAYDDIDDIAFHPQTGQMFAIMNKGGKGGGLVELNPSTGLTIRYIGLFGVDDMEGLAFFNNGTLYGSSGNNVRVAANQDSLFAINVTTGAATLIDGFTDGVQASGVQDIEALGCLTIPVPDYKFRKFVNGFDANDPNDDDTPHLLAGTPVTWTYWVTNTGEVAIPRASIVVTDSDSDVDPEFNQVRSGNNDVMLDPDEVWVYAATGLVPAPETSTSTSLIENLCDPSRGSEWGYKNIGTLTIANSVTLTDPAHICIPVPPSLDADRNDFYEFSYTITNPAVEDGGVPLKNIKVQAASPAVTEIDCPATTLNPTKSMTCTAKADHIAFRNSRGWVTADPVDGGNPIIRVVLPDPVLTIR